MQTPSVAIRPLWALAACYALGTLLVACAVFDGVQRELGRHGPSETFAMLIFSSREQWEKPW